MLKTIASIGAVILLAAAPDVAAAKGMTLKQVKALLSDLGYEPTDLGDNRMSIADQGQYKLNIDFALNSDMSVLNIYTPLSDIPDGKMSTVPMEGLLRANDSTGPFAYAIVNVEDKPRIDLEGYFDTAVVTKPMLRRTIDALIAAEDAGEPLWNADHWTAPTAVAAAAPAPAPAPAATPAAAPKSLEAAKADYEAAWLSSPLKIEHGTFTADSATALGAYTPRADNVFKPGETIRTYLEPVGYAWKPVQSGEKASGLSVDLLLTDTDGVVIADKKNFASKSFLTHGDMMGLYFDLTLTISGLPAGSYSVRYTLHDLNSDKSAELTLPFKIAG